MPAAQSDYQKLFTELIKKQIVILGPSITLSKARNVKGLSIDDAGNVTQIEGDPQFLLNQLINQFVELSGEIVKQTMESVLSNYPGLSNLSSANMPANTSMSSLEPSNEVNKSLETQTKSEQTDSQNPINQTSQNVVSPELPKNDLSNLNLNPSVTPEAQKPNDVSMSSFGGIEPALSNLKVGNSEEEKINELNDMFSATNSTNEPQKVEQLDSK